MFTLSTLPALIERPGEVRYSPALSALALPALALLALALFATETGEAAVEAALVAAPGIRVSTEVARVSAAVEGAEVSALIVVGISTGL